MIAKVSSVKCSNSSYKTFNKLDLGLLKLVVFSYKVRNILLMRLVPFLTYKRALFKFFVSLLPKF